ncbi:MAG: hypothetical protein ACRD3T_17880 [Terriglobia bacterium]
MAKIGHILEILEGVLNSIPAVIDVIFTLLLALAAAYGAIKALLEVPEFAKDWVDRATKKDYRVKTTVLKAFVGEDMTQIIKLRNVRVHTKRDKLELDRAPEYDPGLSAKLATVASHYAVPGRSTVVPRGGVNRFQIDFEPDEELAPHQNHPILLSYYMAEKLETLWKEPGIIASQPVGSERLVIEVYFPRKWTPKKGTAKVRGADPITSEPLTAWHSKPAHVEQYRFDFGDGRGEIDFIRAIVSKPPQVPDILLDWEWEETPKLPPRDTSSLPAGPPITPASERPTG